MSLELTLLPFFAGVQDCSRKLQGIIYLFDVWVCRSEHAPRGPCRLLERRHGLAKIVERRAVVLRIGALAPQKNTSSPCRPILRYLIVR